MNEREKAEIHLKLYEIQVTLFHQRANREFRMIITFFTALAILTGFLAPKIETSLPLIGGYIFVGCLYMFTWMHGFWASNEKDKKQAGVYRSYADELIGYRENTLMFEEPTFKEFFADWATRSQIATLFILLSLSLWLIHVV